MPQRRAPNPRHPLPPPPPHPPRPDNEGSQLGGAQNERLAHLRPTPRQHGYSRSFRASQRNRPQHRERLAAHHDHPSNGIAGDAEALRQLAEMVDITLPADAGYREAFGHRHRPRGADATRELSCDGAPEPRQDAYAFLCSSDAPPRRSPGRPGSEPPATELVLKEPPGEETATRVRATQAQG